jgi:hypothetical protein
MSNGMALIEDISAILDDPQQWVHRLSDVGPIVACEGREALQALIARWKIEDWKIE